MSSPQSNRLPVAGHDLTPVTGRTVNLSLVPIESFDEYAVVARLGQGGMAEVILGLAQGPQGFRKLTAIKRLHAQHAHEPELVRMFLQEATLAARLSHPNVVQTHKVGYCEGRPFMAMEYLDGQSLHRVLHRLRSLGACLDPAFAARLAADALDGLHYIHEAVDYDGTPLAIVHRDISPHNLFVTFDGQVKLLDFGIAKAANVETHTRPGLIKGKLAYISPEQARGQRVDRRADLWSLGVTLWECLSGVRLFRGESEVSVLRAMLSEEIPRLTELRPELPSELSEIVERTLHRDPDERYATAREMKLALESWLASQTEQSAEAARAELAISMRTLFEDTIRERRSTLRACLSQLDELHLRAATQSAEDAPVEAVFGPSEARVSAWTPWFFKAAAVVLSVGIAAVLALWIGEGAQAGKAHAKVEPWVKVASTAPVATSPAQPAMAVPPPTAILPAPVQPAPSTVVAPEPPSAPVPDASAQARMLAMRARAKSRPGVLPVEALATSAPTTAVGEQPLAAPAPAAIPGKLAPGRLLLDSTPYAVVSLNGQRLGITPIEVELPAATHTLVLRNPERGLETTYQVKIPEGERISRRVALE